MLRYVGITLALIGLVFLLFGMFYAVAVQSAPLPWTNELTARFVIAVLSMVVGAVLLIAGHELELWAECRAYWQ